MSGFLGVQGPRAAGVLVALTMVISSAATVALLPAVILRLQPLPEERGGRRRAVVGCTSRARVVALRSLPTIRFRAGVPLNCCQDSVSGHGWRLRSLPTWGGWGLGAGPAGDGRLRMASPSMAPSVARWQPAADRRSARSRPGRTSTQPPPALNSVRSLRRAGPIRSGGVGTEDGRPYLHLAREAGRGRLRSSGPRTPGSRWHA